MTTLRDGSGLEDAPQDRPPPRLYSLPTRSADRRESQARCRSPGNSMRRPARPELRTLPIPQGHRESQTPGPALLVFRMPCCVFHEKARLRFSSRAVGEAITEDKVSSAAISGGVTASWPNSNEYAKQSVYRQAGAKHRPTNEQEHGAKLTVLGAHHSLPSNSRMSSTTTMSPSVPPP